MQAAAIAWLRSSRSSIYVVADQIDIAQSNKPIHDLNAATCPIGRVGANGRLFNRESSATTEDRSATA